MTITIKYILGKDNKKGYFAQDELGRVFCGDEFKYYLAYRAIFTSLTDLKKDLKSFFKDITQLEKESVFVETMDI